MDRLTICRPCKDHQSRVHCAAAVSLTSKCSHVTRVPTASYHHTYVQRAFDRCLLGGHLQSRLVCVRAISPSAGAGAGTSLPQRRHRHRHVPATACVIGGAAPCVRRADVSVGSGGGGRVRRQSNRRLCSPLVLLLLTPVCLLSPWKW